MDLAALIAIRDSILTNIASLTGKANISIDGFSVDRQSQITGLYDQLKLINEQIESLSVGTMIVTRLG